MSRTVLITGATKGLGTAMAERFFNDGYQVVITGTSEDVSKQLADKLDPSGERVVGMELNVQEKAAFEVGLELAINKFGKCDVLINNAAMTPTTSVRIFQPRNLMM